MAFPFAPSFPIITRLDDRCVPHKRVRPKIQINNYLIMKKLGEGAFAKVYLCIDVETAEFYAMKIYKMKELRRLHTKPDQLEREVRIMRKLDHPSIVKLYEVLFDPNKKTIFLILEFANCGSLGNLIDRGICPSLDIVRFIFRQVLNAITYLHQLDIVHQDIKPWNILLTSDARVFLADFGIGHSFQSFAMAVGSPAFQAPEAFSDDENLLDPCEEDVWSLGVTLYQVTFNKLPFNGENMFEIMNQIKSNYLSFPEGGDEEVVALIKMMLEPKPENRISIQALAAHPFIKDAPNLTRFPFPVISTEPKYHTNAIIVKEVLICPKDQPLLRFCQIAGQSDTDQSILQYSYLAGPEEDIQKPT